MDRKQLKLAGKNLFQKNYWYSVLVVFLMFFSGTGASVSPSFKFSVNTTNSGDASYDGSFEGLFGGGGNADFFFDEFIQEPFFIVFIIILVSVFIVASVLGYFIFASFRCGGIRYFLKSRKNQPAEIKEVFENLKDKTNINIAKVTFFRDLSVALWSLLFIIPGIIKSYEYWAIDYILAVRPNIDKDEAKRLSKILMDGNKWRLFELSISFIGWELLSIFTLGLLNIFYVNPYIQATFIEFFSEVRLEALAKGTITPNDIPDYEFIDPQTQYQGQYYAQPKNVVYRPDGMPMGNMGYAQQPVQQPKNVVYGPNGMQMGNMGYAQQPQQPFGQPVQPPFAQPMTQPTRQTVEQPIPQPTEPVVEKGEETPPTTEE